MKKSAIVLIALVLCACMLFSACATTTNQQLTGYDKTYINRNEYEKTELSFDNSDFTPVEFSVDEETIKVFSDSWSQIRNDAYGSYIQSKSIAADPFASPVTAVVELGELEPGYYNITFNMSLSKGSSSYTPVMDLRAFTVEEGTKEVNYFKPNSQSEANQSVEVITKSYEVLGFSPLCAMDATNSFTDYGLDFTVYETSNVTVWVAA